MPIPPPQRYQRSNLTKAQKQEALAACYGVNMEVLTESEIARMRQILAQHDSQAKPVTIHDLNNPPREVYHFQKFPMMVYDLDESYPSRDELRPKANSLGMESVHVPARVVSLVVRSEAALREALEQGWSVEAPTFGEEPEMELKPSYASEVSAVDALIEASRPKRGRPAKAA